MGFEDQGRGSGIRLRSWNGTREPIFWKVGFVENQNGNWAFKLLGNNGGDNGDIFGFFYII